MQNGTLISRREALTYLAAGAALASPAARALAQSVAPSSFSLPPYSLGKIAASKGLLFGSPFKFSTWNLNPQAADLLTNPYVQLFKQQCTLVTVLDQWNIVEPTQGAFNVSVQDEIIDFWIAQGLKVRIHALAWWNATPKWFPSLPSRNAGIDALTNHISTLVGHLKGKVLAYDVVNEAIQPAFHLPGNVRKGPFTDVIGTDWIAFAFRAARAADPSAKLFLNDYHIEGEGGYDSSDEKCAAILAMVDNFQSNNIPIDGIGIQAHMSNKQKGPTFSAATFAKFLAAIESRGLEIYITELDVMDAGLPADIPTRDAAVAEIYTELLMTALACKAVKLIETWGLVDTESYLVDAAKKAGPDTLLPRPLLFDSNLKPKPAWWAVERALAAAPHR